MYEKGHIVFSSLHFTQKEEMRNYEKKSRRWCVEKDKKKEEKKNRRKM